MLLTTIRRQLTLAIIPVLFLILLPLTISPVIGFARTSSQPCPQGKLCPDKGSQHSSPSATNITISSTAGWQQTGLTVQQGDKFTLSYVSGTWTVDVNNYPYVGPDGYPPNIDQQIYQGCKYDSSFPFARLLGQIGNGSDFSVSTGGTFTASASGAVSLRINDQDGCLSDNAGSITLTGTVATASLTVTRVWTADANNNTKTSFAPGDAIHYLVEINNSGSSTVTGTFSLLATGPQQIYSLSGSVSVPPGSQNYYSPSTVPTNAPAGTYTLKVTVTYNGANSSGQSQFTVTSARQTADLVVTKTVAAPAPNSQGDEVDYQITIKNNGPSTATNVTIADNLPSGVFLENPPQTSQGTCTHTDTSATCTLGTIAVGKSAKVFLTGSTYQAGTITNKAKATATQTDPNLANNTGSATITLQSAKTSSTLTDKLRAFGIKLKALGIILGEAQCALGDAVECTVLGTELLADQPGLTGEQAASYLRVELGTLCTAGLAGDDPFECTHLWIYAISELLAPPPAK